MTQILYYVVFILLVVMTVNNFKKLKETGNDSSYVGVYSKILNGAEDGQTSLDEYLKKEKQENLLNKARLLKVYLGLKENEDVEKLLDDIDLKPIFYKNNVFSSKWVLRNSDVFIWICLIFARCKHYGNDKVLNKLYAMLNEYSDNLNNFVEYNLIKGEYSALSDIKDDNYNFLGNYLKGEYPPLSFERKLVTLYKRFATCFLVYKNEEVDEYWKEDISKFAKTMIGKSLLLDLDLYEKFPPILDETDAIKSDDDYKKEDE